MGLMEDLKNRASMIEEFGSTGKLPGQGTKKKKVTMEKSEKKMEDKKEMKADNFSMDNKKVVQPYIPRYGASTKKGKKNLTKAERRAMALAKK